MNILTIAIVNIIWMILMITYYELFTFQRELSNNKFEIILSISTFDINQLLQSISKMFLSIWTFKVHSSWYCLCLLGNLTYLFIDMIHSRIAWTTQIKNKKKWMIIGTIKNVCTFLSKYIYNRYVTLQFKLVICITMWTYFFPIWQEQFKKKFLLTQCFSKIRICVKYYFPTTYLYFIHQN